jgi:hypothetical protein
MSLKEDHNQPAMTSNLKLVSALLLATPLMAAVPSWASDKPRPAPPVKPAAEYPLNDPHPVEKVTLAADPCTEKVDCSFFRLPYIEHGFIPVRVIITNDRDEAIILDDVRMQFVPAEGEKEAAADDEDLNRRLFNHKYAEGTKIPLIPITIHKEPIDKKILNDDADFGFQSTTVPPHSTRAGYVFYDTRGIDDPVLKHAELYIKMIHYVDEHTVKHELFAFTLPFDKWLAAQPKPDPTKKPDLAKK